MIYPEKTCFFTGHRIIPTQQIDYIKSEIERIASQLIETEHVTNFITGGALGFDTIAAYTVLELKEKYPQIKLHLYLPCTDQSKKWRKDDIYRWNDILNKADSYQYIFNHTYMNGCMQMRNRAMVNSSKFCIAYCTRPNSGTQATITYAKEKGINLNIVS